MRHGAGIIGLGLLWLATAAGAGVSPSLQPLIDAAAPGSVVKLTPGVYAGPVVIKKPLILDGKGEVTIDGGGTGSVITLETDGATVRNLKLINSGRSFDGIDAGVQVRGNFNVVSDNEIDDCLFGIDLQQSSSNVVRRNHIRSKPVELGLRGDAIRLWYSFKNRVLDNTFVDSRDMVVWYSEDNTLSGNSGTGGRYSMHFMYSRYNLVERNRFWNNSVGIYVMYSDGVELRDNYIAHATGATGMGLGLKESSEVKVERNQIMYCASGINIDQSPYQPDTIDEFTDNVIAYNGVGIEFNDQARIGNVFKNNVVKGNLTSLAVRSRASAIKQTFEGNYWEDYEGFDRDGDGIGDTPFEVYGYADRIWMDVPLAQFFKGSPMLEFLDFLERLAPFSDPDVIMRDPRPRMSEEATL
jgi:nitrous oxidase accessory protein